VALGQTNREIAQGFMISVGTQNQSSSILAGFDVYSERSGGRPFAFGPPSWASSASPSGKGRWSPHDPDEFTARVCTKCVTRQIYRGRLQRIMPFMTAQRNGSPMRDTSTRRCPPGLAPAGRTKNSVKSIG
jgi:hypothetical protein